MSDDRGLVNLLRSRIGVEFDGESHLTSAEAQSVAAAIERLLAERDEARVYARNFLISFVNRYCDPIESWAPLPDLIGMLTQIDNASTVAGAFRRHAQNAEAQLDKLKEALEPFGALLSASEEGALSRGVDHAAMPDDQTAVAFGVGRLTVGDFRRARQALQDRA